MPQSITELFRELSRVEAGADIFDVVTSKRINAIQDAIMALACGDNINTGPGVRKATGSGWITITADAKGGGGARSGAMSPFFVRSTSKNDYTAISVTPGLVMNEIPYIEGEKMNKTVWDAQGNLVPNTLTPPATDCSIFVQVRIKGAPNGFHPKLDMGEGATKPPGESLFITHVALLGEPISPPPPPPAPLAPVLPDFRVKWDNPSDKTAGAFQIKLADLVIQPPTPGGPPSTGGPKFKQITQFIYDNFRTLALIGDDCVPLALG